MTQPVYVRKSHLLEQEVFILMMMIIPINKEKMNDAYNSTSQSHCFRTSFGLSLSLFFSFGLFLSNIIY